MRKLYLLLDDWDNDRNFVGRELELLASKYEVTVLCDSAVADRLPGVRYIIYKEPGKTRMFVSALKLIADIDAWRELIRASVYRSYVGSGICARISEVLRFYIKADLFRTFLYNEGCFEDGALYYSYWNFRKCYAVTHEISKYKNSRIISRIHGYDLYDEQIPSGYQPFKISMDTVLDKLIFVSEHGMEYYLNKYGRKGSKYELRFLGTKWHNDTETYERREEMTIVSCSRIDECKRVGRIVEALSLIKGVNVRWVHFGDGVLGDEVRELAGELLTKNPCVKYEFRGNVPNAEIHDFYRRELIDAFITSSMSEGNPVSVMEAMSYGIPVIAPSICNFPNMIAGCGIMVSDKCLPSEMAGVIEDLRKMPPEKIMELRRNARSRWEKNYDAMLNSRRFVEEVLEPLELKIKDERR